MSNSATVMVSTEAVCCIELLDFAQFFAKFCSFMHSVLCNNNFFSFKGLSQNWVVIIM